MKITVDRDLCIGAGDLHGCGPKDFLFRRRIKSGG